MVQYISFQCMVQYISCSVWVQEISTSAAGACSTSVHVLQELECCVINQVDDITQVHLGLSSQYATPEFHLKARCSSYPQLVHPLHHYRTHSCVP